MSKDIRIAFSFSRNLKVKKLKAILGNDGVMSLIYLWLYAGENKPNGTLSEMDEYDIAIASDWAGDAEKFVKTLADIRFIEKTDGGYVLHDWERHNPFVAHFEERSAQARKAVSTRYQDKSEQLVSNGIHTEHSDSTERIQTVYEPNTDRATPSPSPSPSPLPLPEKKKPLVKSGDLPESEEEVIKTKYSESFEEFMKLYPRRIGKGDAYKAWQKIAKDKRATVKTILSAVKAQLDANMFDMSDKKEHCPHPATWLNRDGWLDEIVSKQKSPQSDLPTLR